MKIVTVSLRFKPAFQKRICSVKLATVAINSSGSIGLTTRIWNPAASAQACLDRHALPRPLQIAFKKRPPVKRNYLATLCGENLT